MEDTVGVAGMDAPFDPAEKNGRVYGRGSQDMKGGLASMIAAALYLSRNGGADYRIFVRSRTFSARQAAALIVGANSGPARIAAASL